MIYVRGHPMDFDNWSKLGAPGWSYADVLPYFKRMEHWTPSKIGADTSWRGTSGPLRVQQAQPHNPLMRGFLKAGEQAGLKFTQDYNGESQEGFCAFDQTIFSGERFSAAKAYLSPALKTRKNIELRNGRVTRIIFEKGVAKGIEYIKGKKDKVINLQDI